MQISTLDHLLRWIFYFMKKYNQLDKYNGICLSVPGYPNLIPKYKSIDFYSQCNGKDMHDSSRYLIGVVTQTRWGGSPALHSMFNPTIEYTQVLSEFRIYAEYLSHNDATLSYMEDAFCHFHIFNNISWLGRTDNMVKAKANALRIKHVKKRKVDEQINAEIWKLSKNLCEMNGSQNCIQHEIDVSNKLKANFNFQKIHLMSHWVEQIAWYGALQ